MNILVYSAIMIQCKFQCLWISKEHLGLEATCPDVAGDGTLHDLPDVRGEPRQAGQLLGDDAQEVEAAAHRPEILAAHCLFLDTCYQATYSAIMLRLICWINLVSWKQ